MIIPPLKKKDHRWTDTDQDSLGAALNWDRIGIMPDEAEERKELDLTPPPAVRKAALQGLALRKKYGRGGLSTQEAGKLGIGSGVARAVSLTRGEAQDPKTIKRMVAFFNRHKANKDTPPEKGNGKISWLLWGGDPGREWASKMLAELGEVAEKKEVTEKHLAGEHSQGTHGNRGVPSGFDPDTVKTIDGVQVARGNFVNTKDRYAVIDTSKSSGMGSNWHSTPQDAIAEHNKWHKSEAAGADAKQKYQKSIENARNGSASAEDVGRLSGGRKSMRRGSGGALLKEITGKVSGAEGARIVARELKDKLRVGSDGNSYYPTKDIIDLAAGILKGIIPLAPKTKESPDYLDAPLAEYEATGKGLYVFKEHDGRYRWVTFSSNPYKDRDREFVSWKSLEEDVQRADREGNFGPLRWWHVPGVDLGACDFNMLHGKILIESGTFNSAVIAETIKENADKLEVSIGFTHPPDEPDGEGVFHHIRRFERSLCPKGRVSNRFTRLTVV